MAQFFLHVILYRESPEFLTWCFRNSSVFLSLIFLSCLTVLYLLLFSTVCLSPHHIWNECGLYIEKPALEKIHELHMWKWNISCFITFCFVFHENRDRRITDLGSSTKVIRLQIDEYWPHFILLTTSIHTQNPFIYIFCTKLCQTCRNNVCLAKEYEWLWETENTSVCQVVLGRPKNTFRVTTDA